MNNKEYILSETDWGFHLKFQPNTVTSSKNIPGLIDDILEKCKALGKMRILWDSENMIRNSSIVDSYSYAELVNKKKKLPLRVAVYVPSGFEESRFIENIYHNRGTQVKFFASREEGISWLQE